MSATFDFDSAVDVDFDFFSNQNTHEATPPLRVLCAKDVWRGRPRPRIP
jgi:hypothetical protein